MTRGGQFSDWGSSHASELGEELKSVANLSAYEDELDKAADLTLILTSCRLLELLF